MGKNLLSVKDLKNGIEDGYCRICGNFAKLTSDHMPPKACGNNKRVKVTIFEKELIFQNGFNCRTICEDCNNRILGSTCDKEYKKLYDRLASYKQSRIYLSDKLIIDINIKEIIRSYLGHFVSVNLRTDLKIGDVLLSKVNDSESIFGHYRKFVLGESDITEYFDIYYWYYPFSNIVIVPYAGCIFDILKPTTSKISGTVIKMFPLALFVTKKDKGECTLKMQKIDFAQRSLTLDTNHIVNKYFPEHPLERGAIITNVSSNMNIER